MVHGRINCFGKNFTVRVSHNSFKGQKVAKQADGIGPDTGDRLFKNLLCQQFFIFSSHFFLVLRRNICVVELISSL